MHKAKLKIGVVRRHLDCCVEDVDNPECECVWSIAFCHIVISFEESSNVIREDHKILITEIQFSFAQGTVLLDIVLVLSVCFSEFVNDLQDVLAREARGRNRKRDFGIVDVDDERIVVLNWLRTENCVLDQCLPIVLQFSGVCECFAEVPSVF